MSQNLALSTDFKKISLEQETDEVIALVIEIGHDSLTEPIRLSSDPTEFFFYHDDTGEPIYGTVHQGRRYYNFPFGFTGPGTTEDGAYSTGRFVVAAQQDIIVAIRGVHAGLSFNARVINVRDPDVVITPYESMWLTEVSYDAGQVEGTLSFEHFLDDPCGVLDFLPSTFSGLFKNGVAIVSG